ncbi:hypothetical protein HXX76_008034 [Chlamydomonas incerta]|uniref:Uncharacterized protein n=1 Tax=Chlamydomonas incerta TaxID=51695 RepID=A0A835W1E7_CHLIN|nr:hypothetical protein HXX76_008034 [Chlamydomonas incerta]|eukprot:KAG2433663.1 hypothetical protein HXX76_008034 [Chlamydomonas incerta]
MFVFLGSAAWYGATIGTTGPDTDNATSCPSSCLDLKLLQYFLERRICICSTRNLRSALAYSQDASAALQVVLAGFFLLWAGVSTLLMVASADYAQARRERALLLLLQQRGGAAGGGDVAALAEAAGLGPAGAMDMGATMMGLTAATAGSSVAGSPVKAAGRGAGQGANPFGQLPSGSADAGSGMVDAVSGNPMPYPYQGIATAGVVADNVPLLQDAAMQAQQQHQLAPYADPYGYGYQQRVASGAHQQQQAPPAAYGPAGAKPMYG